MKRHPIKKKVNMKTRILLTTISVAVLAAVTFQVNASDALLTPRTAGNQIKVIPGVTTAQPAFAIQTVAPRALGNRLTPIKGTEAAVVKCSAIGSPRYLATAGAAARTGCCNRTLAECPTMNTCGNAK